ncbi:uncharacterized protein BYT42DRAFT_569895 [Radiomyces spectabilis]|uniref:uncharacterized protein n=1 Tax=Radiomyces spectabilis TaxID=64574 RepID=UPI00221E37C9|nr:uncharacterized protein BYT42DRAFT_569895 [Radiomyces spectabilis]KAI8379745.1 hypothetical protein BYT42DRAFT_569895 [Radiomyces spectabilis]
MLLKKSLFILLSIVTLCLLLLVPDTAARVSTVDDVSSWTKDKIDEYLDKYKIAYNNHVDQSTLVKQIKAYKKAVAANVVLFGDKINHVMKDLKITLDKDRKLTKTDADLLMNEIQYHLRRLELQGELTQNRVKSTLGRVHKHVIKQKIMDEARWQEIHNQVLSSFENQGWYQRVLSRYPTDDTTSSASLNRWLHGVAERLDHVKDLSEDQITSVIDHLRHSITSVPDITRIGDPYWREKFAHRLETQTKLTGEQIQKVLDSIEHDVNAYKIFAMDYVGESMIDTKEWMHSVKETIRHGCSAAVDKFWDVFYMIDRKLRDTLALQHHVDQNPYQRATNSIKSVVSSVSSDWHRSSQSAQYSRSVHSAVSAASEFAASATDKLSHKGHGDSWRSSFSHFWADQELEAYRRLGYTEAHIQWIQDYLKKTLTPHKKGSSNSVENMFNNIKHYLIDAKVQTEAQVQREVDRLKKEYEAWKKRAHA